MLDLLLLAAALIPQTPAPEPVRIQVTTRMVEVGVLVHDQSGRSVAGLRAEDFHVLDGGVEEKIRSFSASAGRTGRAGEARISTAILLDYYNPRFGDEAFGRTELLHYLQQMEARTPVALLSLDCGFQVLHDFTTDAASLAGALNRHRPYRPIHAATFRPSKTGIPNIDALDRRVEAQKAMLRSRENASAIAALTAWLARTPGRKNLIWVSTFRGASPDYSLLAARLRADDVAVYPVDVTTPLGGPTGKAIMLAQRTGGIAFNHGNSVFRGIRMAYEDIGSVYVLGYYPSHDRWNGQFRRIQVTVDRPGVEARYRTGYVAALNDSFRAPDPRETLWHVASSPAEARGIVVKAKATRMADGPVELALAVDAHTLSLVPPDRLELLVVPQREDGQTLAADYSTLELDASPAVRDRMLQEGLKARCRVAPPPEARKLRIVLRETKTGALGSATVALKTAN